MNSIGQVLAIQVALNGVNNVIDGLEAVSKKVSSVNNKILAGARAGALWIAAALGMGAASLNAFEAFEQFRRGLISQIGFKEGDRLAKQLDILAIKSIFSGDAFRRSAQYMLALGIAAGTIGSTLEKTARLVSSSGGGDFEFEGAARAIAQISAQGKLLARDFDQLVNAGIPLGQVAKELGLVPGALRESQVSAGDFIRALDRVGERAGDPFIKIGQRVRNMWEAIQKGIRPTGEMVSSALSSMLGFIEPVLTVFTRLNEATHGWAGAIVIAVVALNGISKVLPLVSTLLGYMKGLLSVQTAYNILTTSWGAIVGFVSRLVTFLRTMLTLEKAMVVVETVRAFLAAALAAAVGNIPGAIAAVALIGAAGVGAAVAWNAISGIGEEKPEKKKEPATPPAQRATRRDDVERLYNRINARGWTG